MAKTTKFFNIINNRTTSVTLPTNASGMFVLSTGTGTGYAPTANIYNLQFSSVLYTVPSGKVARFYPLDIYDAIGDPYMQQMNSSMYAASVYAETRIKIGNNLQTSWAVRYSHPYGMGTTYRYNYTGSWTMPSSSTNAGYFIFTTPFAVAPIEFGENNKFLAQYGGNGSTVVGSIYNIENSIHGRSWGLPLNGIGVFSLGQSGSLYSQYSNFFISAFIANKVGGVTTVSSTYSTISSFSNLAGWSSQIWPSLISNAPYEIATGMPDTKFSNNNPFITLLSGETIEVVRSLSATISGSYNVSFFVSRSTFDNPCRYKFFIVEEDVTVL